MKTKAKIILKSLTDLPADTLAFIASVPERAFDATRRALTPSVRLTRRQLRAARRRSAELMTSITVRALTPLQVPQPWTRGGLNE